MTDTQISVLIMDPTDGANADEAIYCAGAIPAHKARALYNLCAHEFDWSCGFDEMADDIAKGSFIAYATNMNEACAYAANLPRLMDLAREQPTWNHVFSIGFSVSGSIRADGSDLDATDFYRAIIKRMEDLDAAGSGAWREAIDNADDSYQED